MRDSSRTGFDTAKKAGGLRASPEADGRACGTAPNAGVVADCPNAGV
jgi:hypothetical protein